MTTVSVDFLQQITLLDPMNRKQTITELKKVLTKPLLISDFKKIWKALYYAMWSSDKYQNQQILATEISQLTRMFYSNFTAFIQFSRAMFHVFMLEWEKIDYWRINKFMLLFREIIEEQIKICKHFNWKTVPQLIALYNETVLNLTEFQTVQGAALHFIQIFVQCMAKHMSDSTVSYVQVKELLEGFLDILKHSPNKTLRDKTIQYVYEYIEERQAQESYLPAFDSKKYGNYVFKLASSENVNPQNRKALYRVAEIFNFTEAEEESPKIEVEEVPKKKKQKKIQENQQKQKPQEKKQFEENHVQQQQNEEQQFNQQEEQEEQEVEQVIQVPQKVQKKNGKEKVAKEKESQQQQNTKAKQKEEKAILKLHKKQEEQINSHYMQDSPIQDEDETIEGDDYSEVRKNPSKLKTLKDIMNSVPVYLFMNPAEKRKYFKSINSRFQEALQKEKGTHCTHNKSVHFDLARNKVKTFKQTDNVLRISKS
ncbi:unnamed protein product (macronuclear) [Paramecium tetraurelia]|uniref:Uncharacterized protein n=1 Tax=Paramecium tetraurelia TaxID=5888 RepID=A0DRZ8_PARTE|nr:uncharacterized protein GSPATT00019519001 [Paramecium tetraurelia]CAK85815.1 unnamed protein product [Paramecium tetraurelia]|eukprot:XP_001453212.1 hypothetical protein (macronuclear) [Paramecium tetraurelia strain d4-2]